MSGVPTAGLPQGYPSPAQPKAPSGLVPQHQVGPYMYGRTNQQNRPDLNPLNSRPAMMVKNMARKRLNEYLRAQGLDPFAEHEEIPALFVLIELMHMTLEPLRTDANRAFRDMPVKVSTSQTVRTVWRRQPYEAVPYEARTFPFHVARMLLQQVENYSYTIYPELVQQGNMTAWKSRPLNNEDVIQVAPVKWRDPNARELEAMNAMANRLQQSQGLASRRQGGQGRLLVSLNPQTDKSTIDATTVAESPDNPDVKTFQRTQEPQVHSQPKPTPEYPDPSPQDAPPPPQPNSSQQYQNTPQGQQQQQPQQAGPNPQMQVDPQAQPQQAGQSTSMKSDLHDPLEDGKEIPETVRRTHQSKEPTPDENQESLPTGQIDPEVAKERQAAVDNAVNQAAGTNNPPPPKPETQAPPPPPPPPQQTR